MHFLCMSWCLTGGKRNLGDPGLRGGEYRPASPEPPDPLLPSVEPPPKQHKRLLKTPPRPLFFKPVLIIMC